MDMDDLKQAAIDAGIGNFRQTYLARGGNPAAFALPREFEVLLRHAPDAFAGYGMLRAGVMRDTDHGGALDLRTKELLFTVLDVALGATDGAKRHAANAIGLGLTVPQLAEALVQCVMAAGITTWNRSGCAVMEHAVEAAAALDAQRRNGVAP
jgi:alkylhydroperoxidase/carboxymuconolactone decarboxylase family protein YurZ